MTHYTRNCDVLLEDKKSLHFCGHWQLEWTSCTCQFYLYKWSLILLSLAFFGTWEQFDCLHLAVKVGIRFENVQFAYQSRPDKKAWCGVRQHEIKCRSKILHQVLMGITLDIRARQDDRHRWQERLWQVHHEQLYFTGPCNKLLKVYNRQSLSGPRRGHFESYSICLDDFLSKVNCCCASMIHKVERFLVRCWRDSRRVRKYWKFWSVFQWVHLPSPMIWILDDCTISRSLC